MRERDYLRVLTIKLDLSDGQQRELETRMRERAYASIEDYVRELIASDLARMDAEEHRLRRERLADLLEEGERSGFVDYDRQSILAEARARYEAG